MKLRMRFQVLSLAVLVAAPTLAQPPGRVVQEVVERPGYVEPHTPGSGASEEMATAPAVEALLGVAPDLNRVSTVRTRYAGKSQRRPKTVLLLIPGFLGGATTLDPLARDLVAEFRGELEVWAVDRRPNQLEDRLGSLHASEGALEPECQTSPPARGCALFEGAQFYFPDTDLRPFGDFPGPRDLDLDLDGVLDPRFPLTDRFGVTRGPILMVQDDARFLAHWGLDTYFRDWKLLVEEARRLVTPAGVVLMGGHSQGTGWSTLFAAYDFDPDPARVDAGYAHLDGLVLLEGGGAGRGATQRPTFSEYQATVASLARPGGPQVFLENLIIIPLQGLAQVGEVGAMAAHFQPDERSLAQRTPVLGTAPLSAVLGAPATNRASIGFFLDDDFSGFGAFRASLGFSDDGANQLSALLGLPAYTALPKPGGLRTWKEYDDPTLPTCPPNEEDVSPGCALLDNGGASDPGDPSDPPRVNGVEREVTSVDTFALTQFGKANGFEWYFASGRPNLDFTYGRDSSDLVAAALAANPAHEGPLVLTQNANVDVPVIAIGGSNGLTPEPKSFASYLGSIATDPAWQEVHIIEGYAHVDVTTAEENDVVPLVADFIRRVRRVPPGHR